MSELDGDLFGAESFESGTKGKFNTTQETNGTITYASGGQANGAKSAVCTFDGTGGTLNLVQSATPGGNVAEWYLRFYFSQSSGLGALDANAEYDLLQVWNTPINEGVLLLVSTDGAGAFDMLIGVELSTAQNLCTTAFTASTTPQMIELHYKNHATLGAMEGRLDGTDFSTQATNVDTATGGGDNGRLIILGMNDTDHTAYPANGDIWYIDDVKMSSAGWIGGYNQAVATRRVMGY